VAKSAFTSLIPFSPDSPRLSLAVARIAPEIERQSLDINEHGEEGYITS
jgi:hypothetical protein